MSEKKEETFELSNLFTTDRMNEGVWFEPYSDGISTGVRFKVLGVGSTKVVNDYAKYTMDLNTVTVKDGLEGALKKQAEINAELASKLVVDIEAADGRKVVSKGEKITDISATMKTLFKKNTLVAELIIKFASSDFNYMAQE